MTNETWFKDDVVNNERAISIILDKQRETKMSFVIKLVFTEKVEIMLLKI